MLKRQLFQVTERIWCVRQPSYLCCSYAVQTDQGIICIDAGMHSDGQDLLALLAAMNALPSELRAILLTHWHNDHAAGAQALHELTGCEIYFHAQENPYLSRQSATQGLPQKLLPYLPEWGPGILAIGLLGNAVPRAVKATRFVSDREQIWGFDVIASPGHTPGHLCYYYAPEKALFAGDALAVIDGEIRYMSRWVTPDKVKARASMYACLEPEIRVLCPGHREPLNHSVMPVIKKMRHRLLAQQHWPFWG